MEVIIASPSNYWISSQAVTIILNALGEPNRIQASIASGAVVSCYMKDIKPASAGPEYADNGDGLLLDNGRNPRRWPLTISPTYFNSNTEKYIYVAIPKTTAIGSQAQVVFPSEMIDIYGYTVVEDPDTHEQTQGERIGTADYFYIWLRGIISSSGDDGTTPREWTQIVDTGSLGTYEDIINMDSDWYKYSTIDHVVHFLKEIVMDSGSKFRNLKAVLAEITDKLTLGTGNVKGDLVGIAKDGNRETVSEESETHVVTPSYLKHFGEDKFLSKLTDDEAAGLIGFLKGIGFGPKDPETGKYRYTIDKDGVAHLFSLFLEDLLESKNIIFDKILKSKDAKKGFLDGKGIYMDADEGLIETDGLNVRGFMRVMELIINRLQLMESDYSFTEGADVEHIDYASNGLILTIHKEHDNDYLPFYYGDILYAKVNNLLPKGTPTPEGHIESKHGSYYTVWLLVKNVDFSNNTISVMLYNSLMPDGTARVPGAHNFTPYGTSIRDYNDDPVAALAAERDIAAAVAMANNVVTDVKGATLGERGFDTHITLTRHGNIADGINPETGEHDEHIYQSQLGRQQAWLLSTTDQRLSFFWRVATPIIEDDNYALCLGILPDLENLPHDQQGHPLWNTEMPSLYINTLFADNIEQANYPAKVVREVRGQWSQQPTAAYNGDVGGTWTPDGTTITMGDVTYGNYVKTLGQTGVPQTVATGDTIDEPYHYRTFTKATWLEYRLSPAWRRKSDAELEMMLLTKSPKADLEVSRVWKDGKLWECLVDGTTQEPSDSATDWLFISDNTEVVGDVGGAAVCHLDRNTLFIDVDPNGCVLEDVSVIVPFVMYISNEKIGISSASLTEDGGYHYASLADGKLTDVTGKAASVSGHKATLLDATVSGHKAILGSSYVGGAYSILVKISKGTVLTDHLVRLTAQAKASDGRTYTAYDSLELTTRRVALDGDGVQYVFKVFDHELTQAEREANTPVRPDNPNEHGEYVPTGWSDDPVGTTIDMQFEYVAELKHLNGAWGQFETISLWSKWSERGVDGDGVEYVFMRTRKNTAPIIDNTQTGYDVDEFLPAITNKGVADAESNTCTDDPKGTDSEYKYEWVAKRTKGEPDAEGRRSWNKFPAGPMSLWANFSESIRKESETYRYATNNTGTRPDASSQDWSTTKPTLQEGYWLYTETTITWSDGSQTVLYTDERNPNDGLAGQDIIVDGSTVMKYYVGDSNTTHPAEDSSDWKDLGQVTQTQGKWLWSKATTYYRKASSAAGSKDAGYSVNYNVSYISKDGATGRAMTAVTEYYKANNSSNALPKPTSDDGWSTDPNLSDLTDKWDQNHKYLWNYEKVEYTESDGSKTYERTVPQIVAIWSKDGKGIDSIVNYYKITNSDTAPTRPSIDGVEGWDDDPTAPGPGEYLWNYEKVTYTDGSEPYHSDVQLIGHVGEDGQDAAQCYLDRTAVFIPTDSDGKVLDDFEMVVPFKVVLADRLIGVSAATLDENGSPTYASLYGGKLSDITGKMSVSSHKVSVTGATVSGHKASLGSGYVKGPSAIYIKVAKGVTLEQRRVGLSVTAKDSDGNTYNCYAALTVERNSHGKNGDTPIAVYTWNESPDEAPAISGNAYPPSGWSKTAPNRPDTEGDHYLWMSQSTKHGDGAIDPWSTPVRISGDKGSAGEDGDEREWIYSFSNTGYDGAIGQVSPDGTAQGSDTDKDQKDWVPNGWRDNPAGVSDTNKTEYASWRDITNDGTTKTYGAFHTPIVWSHYGERGMDGDGVQYVFKVFDHELTQDEREANTPTRPANPNEHGEYVPTGWSDDPVGTTVDMQYEYVAVLKRINGVWGQFETISLWSKWSEDGADGQDAAQCYLDQTAVFVPTDADGNVLDDFEAIVPFRAVLADRLIGVSAATLSENGSPTYASLHGGKLSDITGKMSVSSHKVSVTGATVSGHKASLGSGYVKGPSAIYIKVAKGVTLEQRRVVLSVTAKDSDGNTYNCYASLTVESNSRGVNGDTPIAVYQWNGSPDEAPAISGNAYPPSGWSKTAPNRPDTEGDHYLWMSQSTKHGDGTIDSWSTPVRISGDKGSAGEDATNREWVYKRQDASPGTPPSSGSGQVSPSGTAGEVTPYDPTLDDWVPAGWSDSPLGVTDSNKTEWASWRDKDIKTGEWGAFHPAIIWSHYGERGMDGDGVEYVFVRTNSDTVPTITDNDPYTEGGKTIDYTMDEFRPMTSVGRATDDPTGVDQNNRYEYVAMRRKVLAADGKTREWPMYDTGLLSMSRWAMWGVSVDYEIRSTMEEVTIGADETSGQLSTNLTFFKKTNGSTTAYSCFYAVYRRKDNVITFIDRNTVKSTSGSASHTLSDYTTVDAYVVVISDTQITTDNALPATYLTKLEIRVTKQGGNGPKGDDASFYQLVTTPDAVNFRSNAVGDYTETKTVVCAVKKIVGNDAPASITPGAGSGVYLYYRTYKPNGSSTDYSQWYDYTTGWSERGDNVLGAGLSGLEFALSTASAKASVADNNIIVRKTVAIIFDGRRGAMGAKGDTGNTGATGRMFYSMGTYEQKVYYRTDLLVPLVWLPSNVYNEAVDAYGDYWYVKDGVDEVPADEAPHNDSDYWEKATSFGLVITQGIFAEFAKLGKAIMSGDYMFSMNGFVDGVEKVGGALWRDRKAYTLFVGDPDAYGFSASGTRSIGTDDVALYDSGIQLAAGEQLVVKLVVTSRVVTTRLRIYNGEEAVQFYYTNESSTVWMKAENAYLTLGVNTYYIRYTADEDCTCYIKAYKTATPAGDLEYSLKRILFEPNWWVDLLTGKMVAARGNFSVEPDGSVKVKGTINAQNFYHNICIASQGYYQNNIDHDEHYYFNYDHRDDYDDQGNIDRTSVEYLSRLTTGNYYSKTQIKEMTNDYFGNPRAMYSFIPCTGEADYVQCVPSTSGTQFARSVVLPRPEDYEGKVIEVSGWSRTTSDVNITVTTVKSQISGMSANCMSNAITVDTDGKIGCDNTQSSITITTGKAYRFASMRLGNDPDNPCIWVKINYN